MGKPRRITGTFSDYYGLLLGVRSAENPIHNKVWQEAAGFALLEGRAWNMSLAHMETIAKIFGIQNWIHKEPLGVTDFLQGLFSRLDGRKGICWKKMIK